MSDVTTKPRRRTRKPVVLAKVIPFVRPVTIPQRIDAARADLKALVLEPRYSSRLPEYRERYFAACKVIDDAHAIAAGPLVVDFGDGQLEPSGEREIKAAWAFLCVIEATARTAQVIDLAAYRRARAKRAS